MKLYETYCKVIESIKPIKLAWFTTFNLDAELLEKYLLAPIGNRDFSTLKTAEDFEGLNLELKNTKTDIKVWYDYRGLNLRSPKRTIVPFISVDPARLYKKKSSGAIFHPKVILILGEVEAYLICGSANISFAAWSNNCESVLVKKIVSKKNAKQILQFFSGFTNDTEKISEWIGTLKNHNSDWDFVGTSGENNVFVDLIGAPNTSLTVWSPYFAENTNGLCQKLFEKGFENIDLVPDIAASGKVRILNEQLSETNNNNRIAFLKRVGNEELSRFYHAKVWLSNDKIAVGSWNFSYRATGISIAKHEQNFEAGILADAFASLAVDLKNNLEPFGENELMGSSSEEINSEWEQVLNDFTFSCVIKADWGNFTYLLDEEFCKEGFSISLPDHPDNKISLSIVNNLSFRGNYIRVLKNKVYSVFDNAGKEVFKGYIEELRTELRPVYNYNTLHDLLDALLENPLGETSRKKIAYALDESEDNPEEKTLFFDDQHSSDSYYRMFVSFQKLYDSVEKAGEDQNQLDKIGFRLPSSLVNIIRLVEHSIIEIKKPSIDQLLFFWFITQEINRSLKLFNLRVSGEENHLKLINHTEILELLNLEESDTKFMEKLIIQFKYGSS